MSERTRALVITGPFEDWELQLFAKLMRDMERARPDETFSMAVSDVDSQGIGEALKLLERVFPRREKPH